MPLCPQITNTPITVVLNADFTVTSVVPVLAANTEQLATTDAAAAAAVATANAAAVTAGTAQSTANTALANAATAYAEAIGSLQPSADTIVNASNQMTAISANGITVYSGASASSGARVVLNSTGLAGFDSGGTASFSISASTGAAVFRGNITTGATITGGTLNIAGKTIIDGAGLLTGTDVTLTGEIRATAGYFGTVSNGFSINSTGLVGVGTGIIVGGTITTSAGSASVSLVGSNNSLTFKTSSTNVGHILPLSSFGVLTHYGATADPSGGTFPQMFVGSTGASIFANSSIGIGVNTSGIQINASGSAINLNNQTNYTGIASGSGTAVVSVATGGRLALGPSSARFKININSISQTGWLNKIANLNPVTYLYDPDFTVPEDVPTLMAGFFAEDFDEVEGLETVVNYDSVGDPLSIAYDRFTVFLVLAIKELKAEIDQLKGA